MENTGKYNTIKIIGSAIATAVGLVLVIAKMYSYIGIILLSFGSVVLVYSLETRKKGIISDELTEWIAGRSAILSFNVTWATVILLLAVDIYNPEILETYVSLGILMFALVGARFGGEYYYGKVREDIGF